MDLEDELNRLFHDERLDMRVAPDAETHVVAGARRVHRRRVALMSAAGVLSAAVLAGGAFVLAQPNPPSNEIAQQPTLPIETTSAPAPTGAPSPAPTESPTSTEADPPSSQTVRPPAPPATTRSAPGAPSATPAAPTGLTTLGPSGIGRMRLGMTEEQLAGTAQAQPSPRPSAGCVTYMSKTATGTVHLSEDRTVVAFVFTGGVATPERVSIGATEEMVRSAYPGMTGTTVKVPGNANATYEFTFTSGKVSKIALLAAGQGCV